MLNHIRLHRLQDNIDIDTVTKQQLRVLRETPTMPKNQLTNSVIEAIIQARSFAEVRDLQSRVNRHWTSDI